MGAAAAENRNSPPSTIQAWGGGSVSKVLALQAWGPEFKS